MITHQLSRILAFTLFASLSLCVTAAEATGDQAEEAEAAVSEPSVSEPSVSEPIVSEPSAAAQSKSEQSEATAKPEAPKDTLGGDGLKNRKLSDIFEQFVPTETISADNAVPFPVDI